MNKGAKKGETFEWATYKNTKTLSVRHWGVVHSGNSNRQESIVIDGLSSMGRDRRRNVRGAAELQRKRKRKGGYTSGNRWKGQRKVNTQRNDWESECSGWQDWPKAKEDELGEIWKAKWIRVVGKTGSASKAGEAASQQITEEE